MDLRLSHLKKVLPMFFRSTASKFSCLRVMIISSEVKEIIYAYLKIQRSTIVAFSSKTSSDLPKPIQYNYFHSFYRLVYTEGL